MVTLDSDFVINQQYQFVVDQQLSEVDNGQQKIDSLVSEYRAKPENDHSDFNNILKKVNHIFISQLMSSQGLVYDIQQKQEILKGKDLSGIIGDLNDLIKKNIELNSSVESIISGEMAGRFTDLQITVSVVSETIEHLYKALRDLKKANKKTPVPTSDLAKNTALGSLKTLEKVMNEH